MSKPPDPVGVTALPKGTDWFPSALLVYTLSGRMLGREGLRLQALGLYLGLGGGYWPPCPGVFLFHTVCSTGRCKASMWL